MKLEIGGGVKPRGEGFLNVDQLAIADIRCNLNTLPWPIESESVDELYSSHCIEHVNDPEDFMRECARICKIGAKVEIRCPDINGEMMFTCDHKSCVSINAMRHMDHIFPEKTWSGEERKLHMERIEPGADDYWFPMARRNPLFSMWSDDDILTWLPRTRHENRFHFTVIENPYR